ncbi:subfamily B ATP-binding cassette protein MsbA [Chryseobacterium sp. SORGH_AS909]|nr:MULTISPECIES: ABC transporter transmembrane domain-containing protein [unclassified Chryseobacterium]MDQ1102389.1 subfamily B ATP-binding cassette protein MsbA [Chryseobacterium sp. SORGH_AS_1048]MDR6085826.1 subfamily B ATP-binding cassette protein MsbA [Chryseobacterium sp. SORGH_AS_0909]MDR6130190.1 subfamily B ATP-binding cassette protein MsbA [Chryseobacterium sp. SORGH_AS_1175]MDT3407682.1 subfamily B ATP-binding cassette protein MsbA [Pseudacidovorax intermedius]
MSYYKRAIDQILPYKKSIAAGIFFNILYALFNIIAMLFFMPVLNILFDKETEKIEAQPVYNGISSAAKFLKDSFNYYIQQLQVEKGPEYILLITCILFITMFFLRNIFSYLSEFYLTFSRTGVSRDFRIKLHDKILELPVSFFTNSRKGDVFARITSDVGEVESNILNSLIDIIRSPIVIIITMGYLLYSNFELTIFTLIVFPIMGTLISIIGKSLKKDTGEAQNELGKMYSFVDETLVGLKIIKIFDASPQIKKRFDEVLNTIRHLSLRLFKKKALASPVSELLGAITIGMIVYFGGRLAIQGKGLSGSEFITYIALFYTILQPLKALSSAISNLQKGEVSAKRIFEILDADFHIKEVTDAKEIKDFEQSVEFRNITFGYEEKEILKNFSISIPKGKTIALVGQSGSGKSTITNLITRFYDVNKGEILVDGENIKKIKLSSYRKLFGLVTQDNILFNDSIRNNISLGKPDASLEEIQAAAKVANAHDFIMDLPKQYDTNIGEAGGKLSGGQKQRISIARAVLKNPPIMILDEATSSLDTESERFVQDALEKMMENRTSLVIAHRLSTIQKADWIIVMEKGNIIEQGTHHELINKKGMYNKLVELQNFN